MQWLLLCKFFIVLRRQNWSETVSNVTQVLQLAAGCGGNTSAEQVQVLRCVRPPAAPQDQAPPAAWGCACISAVLPATVNLLHTLLAPAPKGLAADQLQVMCKSILRACTLQMVLLSIGPKLAARHAVPWAIFPAAFVDDIVCSVGHVLLAH